MHRKVVQHALISCVLFAVVVGLFMLPTKLKTGSADAATQDLVLTGIIRDFRAEHPDFDVTPTSGYGHYAGNVGVALGADGRPVFTGGGYNVLSQWRDAAGHPIAPHLYDALIGNAECMTLPGIAADGLIDINNQALIDSFDSRIGPYGPGNTGSDALVTTNSTGSGMLSLRNSSNIFGDCLIGPGGDTDVVFETSPACELTGTMEAMTDAVPMPVLTEPLLGPSSGDRIFAPGSTTTIVGNLHVDRLELGDGAVLEISGQVNILCEGLCELDRARITVLPDSALRLFLKGGMMTTDSPMNQETGDPARMMIFNLDGEAMEFLGNQSLLTARIFAPDADLLVRQGSEIFGTFVGDTITLDNNAKFHVDVAYSGTPNVQPDIAGAMGNVDDGGISTASSFAQWFRDIPGVSLSKAQTITLTAGFDGVWEHDTDAFHPVDNEMFGNEGEAHNDYFSYTLDARFIYEPCIGQMIEFEGDDDTWIYIDRRLVMDLGGVAPGGSQRIDLDRLGLVGGQEYQMLFLHARRQDSAATFHLRTNIPLSTDSVVPTVTNPFD